MKTSQYRRICTVIIGLMLIAQVLFLTPNAVALDLPESEGQYRNLPAGLSEEELGQVMDQVDDSYEQQAYLKADYPDDNDIFGFSVAIDGDTLVVGAWGKNNGGPTPGANDNSGGAFVFTRSGTTWTQQAYLEAIIAEPGDVFGYSVDISGDTIVVGAYKEDSNGNDPYNNSGTDTGAAYVYVRSGKNWTLQAYLKAHNVGDDDHFGHSVSIDGDFIVVGAPLEDGEGTETVSNSGAAYIFERDSAVWTQQAYLKAPNPDSEDWFGYSVGIDGRTIVVGAYRENGDGKGGMENDDANDAGAAYVFIREKINPIWGFQAYLKAANAESGDQFGLSVAVAENTIVVGAPSEDGDGSAPGNNDEDSSGAAYVFTRSGQAWTQQAYLKAANLYVWDKFGCSVAVDGNRLVVGAEYEDGDGSGPGNNDEPEAGAAYVFERIGSVWKQLVYLKASNAEEDDYFGRSVDLSGDTFVVGARGEDSDGSGPENNDLPFAGAAYVFIRRYSTFLPFVTR